MRPSDVESAYFVRHFSILVHVVYAPVTFNAPTQIHYETIQTQTRAPVDFTIKTHTRNVKRVIPLFI